MTVLRDISILWSFFHILVIFIFLHESRFSRKKTVVLTTVCMGAWLILHGVLLAVVGPYMLTQLILLTGTIPSLVFFWFMSKRRDGRFFFIFCLCDTISAEILLITNLLDYHVFGGTYIFMLIARLIAFPLLEIFVWRVMRPVMTGLQRSVKRGWWGFSAVSVVFYIMLIVVSSVPTPITEAPERLPMAILIIILMPLMYFIIMQALRRQQKVYELAEVDNILKLQVANMHERLEQFAEADNKFRIERHDMRHRLRTINEMVQAGNTEEMKVYLSLIEEKLTETTHTQYCVNPVLDAVFNAYFRRAEARGVKVEADIAVPLDLKTDVAELSSVFANAIENAVNACEYLEEDKRVIAVKTIAYPQFMFQVTNAYEGVITLDGSGMPVTVESGHGYGMRSILAFCEKYNAFWEIKTENQIFTLRIVVE